MKINVLLHTLIILFLNLGLIYAQNEQERYNDELLSPIKLINQNELKGIYLFNPNIDIDSFFATCKKLNINSVSTIEYFYKNKGFLEKARQYGIQVILNFPVFFDQEYLERNPQSYCIDSKGERAISEWLHFVCPSQSEFIEYKKTKLREWLELVNPKIVSLDFIRFFVFWEKVYPDTKFEDIVDGCYCEKCIEGFKKSSHLSLEEESPEWIRENVLQDWANWKCDLIEHVVDELVNVIKKHDENILIALKVVPWREKDFNGAIQSIAGQDIAKLSNNIDIFIPMTYSHMLKREPGWINEITSEIHTKTGKQVLASIQIEKLYLNDEISDDEFLEMMKYGNLSPASGVILFHYDFIPNTHKKCLKL